MRVQSHGSYYSSYKCLKGGYIEEALPVPCLLVPGLLVILSREVETESFDRLYTDGFVRLNNIGLSLLGTDGLVLLGTDELVRLGIDGLVLLNTDGLDAERSGRSGSGLNKI